MKQRIETVQVEKIIYGGQGLATLEDGKKLLLWGGLPGETVRVRVTKSKRSWAEGIVEKVVTPAPERREPEDPESYLSTSPWQTLDYAYENQLKATLIVEQFKQHGIELALDDFTAPDSPYAYRNKVEFSFWWSKPETTVSQADLSATPNNSTHEDGGTLDLAFFKRGSHSKLPVEGTSLATPEINAAAIKIRNFLRTQNTQARDLKTLLIRSNQAGEVIAQLYTKNPALKLNIDHQKLAIAGFSVHYSNPKSPASIITETLQESGATQLADIIMGNTYTYAAHGFFQINLPMYEAALGIMAKYIRKDIPLLDFYSGVGSIGLSLAQQNQPLVLVESDERCIAEAHANAKNIKPDTHIEHATSETAISYITGSEQVIVDPPRAGLHQKIVDRLLETKPESILYLSCNPATQARDIALLSEVYELKYAHGFNFFPRTPHIENFIVLQKKA